MHFNIINIKHNNILKQAACKPVSQSIKNAQLKLKKVQLGHSFKIIHDRNYIVMCRPENIPYPPPWKGFLP